MRTRTITMLSVLAALAVPVVASARFLRFGPPTLCFPVDVGSAETLPTERSALARDVSLESAALAVLGRSTDAMVHMETLRRAQLMVASGAEADRLIDRLKDRVLLAEVADASAHDRALAWFDLGYCLRTCEHAGRKMALDPQPELEKAARCAPDDAALQFGAAVGSFDSRGGMPLYYGHVAAAARLAPDASSPVGKNLAAIVKWFTPELLAGDYHELARRAEAARAASDPGRREF